jgi:hypothetical protein
VCLYKNWEKMRARSVNKTLILRCWCLRVCGERGTRGCTPCAMRWGRWGDRGGGRWWGTFGYGLQDVSCMCRSVCISVAVVAVVLNFSLLVHSWLSCFSVWLSNGYSRPRLCRDLSPGVLCRRNQLVGRRRTIISTIIIIIIMAVVTLFRIPLSVLGIGRLIASRVSKESASPLTRLGKTFSFCVISCGRKIVRLWFQSIDPNWNPHS